MLHRYLLIAILMLTGCATVTPPLRPITLPALDQVLALDCDEVPVSAAPDYDAWQRENAAMLAVLSDCAIRHHQTVRAYNMIREGLAK